MDKTNSKLLILAVVLKSSGQILAVLKQDFQEYPLAIQIALSGGLRLDTARYDLAKEVRAFGLVIGNGTRYDCTHDAGFGDVRLLYVHEDGRIQQVMEQEKALRGLFLLGLGREDLARYLEAHKKAQRERSPQKPPKPSSTG